MSKVVYLVIGCRRFCHFSVFCW